MTEIVEILSRLEAKLTRIEERLEQPFEPRFQREWYTVAEAAEILGKAAFTVREWARLNRIHATKRASGRGRALEWMISHQELERIQDHGLLPLL